MRRAFLAAALMPTTTRDGGHYAPMAPQASSALVPYQARVVLTWDSPGRGATQLGIFVLAAACAAIVLAVRAVKTKNKPKAAPPLTTPAAKLGLAAAASPCSVDLLDDILRDVDAELRAVRGA